MRTSCSADCKNCSNNGYSMFFCCANHCALNPPPSTPLTTTGVSSHNHASIGVNTNGSAPDKLFESSYSSRPWVFGSVPSYASAAGSVPINLYSTGPSPVVVGGSSSTIHTSKASETTPADIFRLHPIVPPCTFDYSTTPLHCFLNFPSSDPSSCNASSFATIRASLKQKGKEITLPGKATSKPSCGLMGQAEFGGTRLASYTQTHDENAWISSISAMPDKDKGHEELRLQHYQMQGTAGKQVDSESNVSTQLALPIFVMTMMPTNNSGGFGTNYCAPTLGSSVRSISWMQIGTVPATLSTNGLTIKPTFAESFSAIPLHHASGSSTGFGSFGSSPATHCTSASSSGFGSFGSPSTMHHAPGSSCSFGSFGAQPATHNASGSSPGFGSFGTPSKTHHAPGSSSGFGSFGAPPATHCAFGSSSGFGSFGAPPATHHASGSSSGVFSFGTPPATPHAFGSSSGVGSFGTPPATTPHASGSSCDVFTFGTPQATSHASGSSLGVGSFSYPLATHHSPRPSSSDVFSFPPTRHQASGSSSDVFSFPPTMPSKSLAGFGSFGTQSGTHHTSGSSTGFSSLGARPPMCHTSGSSAAFGSFGTESATHRVCGSSAGFCSFGAQPPTCHTCGSSAGFSSFGAQSAAHHVSRSSSGGFPFGTPPATHRASPFSTGFASFGAPSTTHHASGSSAGFGSFGTPSATHHAPSSSAGFGSFGAPPTTHSSPLSSINCVSLPTTHNEAPAAPTLASSAGSTPPTHHGTIAGCGISQATPFGAPCSNTGLCYGQNAGAIVSAEPQLNAAAAATQINGAP